MSDKPTLADETPSAITDHPYTAPPGEPWGCCAVEVGGLPVADMTGRVHLDGMRCDHCGRVARPHGCGWQVCPLATVEWVQLRRCGLAEAAHVRSATPYTLPPGQRYRCADCIAAGAADCQHRPRDPRTMVTASVVYDGTPEQAEHVRRMREGGTHVTVHGAPLAVTIAEVTGILPAMREADARRNGRT